MLIKKINVENFLPYKTKQSIEFSTNSEKNVTLIMGNNGAGKTSLAQAFEWCLYGTIPEGTNSVLNRYVRDHLSPGSYSYAVVSIEMAKDDVNYVVERRQKYSRKANGELDKPGVQEFLIEYQDNAETKQVPLSDQQATINKLLSKELSHYFFFDGEHVKKMRTEIDRGKSTDFANAVKSILGLQHISSAMEHLKAPGTRNSVEKWFRRLRDDAGDRDMQNYLAEIESLEKRIESLEEDLNNALADETIARDNVKKWFELLQENAASEEAINAVAKAQKRQSVAKDAVEDAIKSFFEVFRENQYRFIADQLVHEAQQELANEDKISKGIPSVNDKTLRFLIERGECLCGAKFQPGDDAFQHLTELFAYVPPKDLGTYISEFEKECQIRTEGPSVLYSKASEAYKRFGNSVENEKISTRALQSAKDYLESLNHVDVKHLRSNHNKAENDLRDAIGRAETARRNISSAKSKIVDLKKQLETLYLANKKNQEVKLCLSYVDYIYDYLADIYGEKEKSTREKLEKTVDHYFTTIYDGELHLELDENYGVTVVVDGLKRTDETWKTSGGQTLSIVLAFIAGVLDIARQNSQDKDSLLQGDTYPLVMDAPLSDFDKERIETICSVLPNVAEQVIIIIKDTDGELAEQHLRNQIGARYTIDKLTDYESIVRR